MRIAVSAPEKIYVYDLSFSIGERTVTDLCQLIYQLMMFKMEAVILKETG